MKKKTGVIVSSVAAIAVSASVIAGSTYALFTSESQVDISVSSANVEVSASVTEAELNRPVSINADTYAVTYAEKGTALSDVTGKKISLDDIQPGDKITLNLLIESKSTVNFKYRVSLVKTGGDQNLYENLLVGIDGSYYSDYVSAWTDFSETTEAGKPITVMQSTVEVLMPAYLGNEYKNSSCNVALKVEAVQGNVDKTAEAGTAKKVYPVYSQNDLNTALAGVGEGETIVVMQKWGEVSFETDKTNFNVKGCNLGNVTFNAPNATVEYNVPQTDSLNVNAIAGESLHVYGSVGGLEITSGHVVLESGATVNAVTLGENADETVKLDVKEGATINTVAEEVDYTTFVSTEAGLVSVMLNGGNIKLIDNIILTHYINLDKEQEVHLDFNGKTITYAPIDDLTTRPFIIRAGASLSVYGSTDYKPADNFTETINAAADGVVCNVSTVYGIFDVYGTLNVYGGHYQTNGDGEGAIVRGRPDSNTHIYNGVFVCIGYNAAINDEGDSIIEDGYFYTNSSNRGGFNYCVRCTGGSMHIKNATVYGIQGGIAIAAGTGVIDNCYSEVRDPFKQNEKDNRSFYALYINGERGEAECTVNGGTFVSEYRSAVNVGNKAVGDGGLGAEVTAYIYGGNFVHGSNEQFIKVDYRNGVAFIYGGTYSTNIVKAVDTFGLSEIVPQEGYEITENADGTYTVNKKV